MYFSAFMLLNSYFPRKTNATPDDRQIRFCRTSIHILASFDMYAKGAKETEMQDIFHGEIEIVRIKEWRIEHCYFPLMYHFSVMFEFPLFGVGTAFSNIVSVGRFMAVPNTSA